MLDPQKLAINLFEYERKGKSKFQKSSFGDPTAQDEGSKEKEIAVEVE
jgi:hypothetical protein